MKHLFHLADIESAFVRRLVLFIHLPLVAYAFVTHLVRAAVAIVAGIFHDVVSIIAGVPQDVAHQIVGAAHSIISDVRYVWRGRSQPKDMSVQPQPQTKAAEIGAVPHVAVPVFVTADEPAKAAIAAQSQVGQTILNGDVAVAISALQLEPAQ